jgi:hypothetical protein
LAAAVDGEGCLIQRRARGAGWKQPVDNGVVNRLVFAQNDNAMLAHVKASLDEEGFHFEAKEREHVGSDQWKPTTHVALTHRRDLLRFLGQYRPVRLLPQLDLELLGTINSGQTVRLIEKEFVGLREVVAMETTTHTFIAEGLASHNCQKVPLNVDRDNVTPAYLRALRTFVLNKTFEELRPQDATATWAREALGDSRVEPAAVVAAMDVMFGERRVSYDPSDSEANAQAVARGYTVVHGGSLSRDQWEQARRAEAIRPAGQVLPTPRPESSPDGVPPIPENDWTPGMRRVARYAKAIGAELLGFEPEVEFFDVANGFAAWWGGRRLAFNLRVLGRRWFEQPNQELVDALLIHEFSHANPKASNHLSHEFHDELCRLGARLRRVHVTLASLGSWAPEGKVR